MGDRHAMGFGPNPMDKVNAGVYQVVGFVLSNPRAQGELH